MKEIRDYTNNRIAICSHGQNNDHTANYQLDNQEQAVILPCAELLFDFLIAEGFFVSGRFLENNRLISPFRLLNTKQTKQLWEI